jgi:MFS family permease
MNARVGDLPGEVLWESRGDPRRWFSLPVLLVGALLPVLDFNAVNLALPAIQKTLGATSSQVQFVISAYAATYAVFLITGGRLGDWFGRKPMFLLGVAGFTLASVLCGTAQTPGVLIGSRIFSPPMNRGAQSGSTARRLDWPISWARLWAAFLWRRSPLVSAGRRFS